MAIKVTGNIVIDDTQAISNITSISSNGQLTTNVNHSTTVSGLALTGTITSSAANIGYLKVGANLNYTDVNIIGSMVGNANGFVQLILQNQSTGIAASTDFIVSNDSASNALYGDFGINSTTFSGAGPFDDANGTFVYAAGGTFAAGTLGANNARIATNNVTRVTILANGLVGIANTAPAHVLSVTGNFNTSGNANVLNLGTAQVLATANVTAPQLISNVATGTAPLLVTSTTVVANLNANALQGNTPSQTATANSIVQRNADGNIAGNFFIGNGSQLTGISAGFPLANGTSNINAPASGGNINISVGGAANVLITTSTGVNVTGYLTVTGNITGGIISNSTNVFSTAASNYAIGYRQMPQNSQSGATYTLVLDDEGKSVYLTGTTTCTVTIPANSSQAFPIGSVLTMINNNSGALSINSSATLQLANGNAANRSVATKGMATCIKVATDTWYIIGTGVT